MSEWNIPEKNQLDDIKIIEQIFSNWNDDSIEVDIVQKSIMYLIKKVKSNESRISILESK